MKELMNTLPSALLRKTLLGLALFSVPAAADAQVFTNGTFTDMTGNSVTPAGWTNVLGYNPGQTFGSWPSVDVLDINFSAFFGNSTVQAAPSPHGGTWGGLCTIDPGNIENEAIEQTITGLTVGQEYEVSFYAANFGGENMFDSPERVMAFVDG